MREFGDGKGGHNFLNNYIKKRYSVSQTVSEFFNTDGMEWLIKNLTREGTCLWRYCPGQKSFSRDQWADTIYKSWKPKNGFPVLYHEDGIYDKREVAICFVMCAGMTPEESDQFFDEMSVKNQSYDTRRLYPLHFKEGFFRMLMAWGEKHGDHIGFSDAVCLYCSYEERVYEDVLTRFYRDEEKYQNIQENCAVCNQDPSDTLSYFRGLCAALAQEMQAWNCPLKLDEQDKLQRMLVQLSHYERCLNEYKNRTGSASAMSTQDIQTRNRNTRAREKRGTKLGSDVISRCAARDTIEEAVDCFFSNAVLAMGEAYWRAISFIMAKYAASGKDVQGQRFVMPRIFSKKNKTVKTFKEVGIFAPDVPDEERILSFALDIHEVKELIRQESANTVLLASLFLPSERSVDELFSVQPQNINQSAVSLLLRSYAMWCEGKTEITFQGHKRYPSPYYNYKRNTMIKFALGCGCRSYRELKNFLELSGSQELNRNRASEDLVYKAFSYAREYGMPMVEAVYELEVAGLHHISLKIADYVPDDLDELCRKVESAEKRFEKQVLYGIAPAKLSDGRKTEFYRMWIYLDLIFRLLGEEPEEIEIPDDSFMFENMADISWFRDEYSTELAESLCHDSDDENSVKSERYFADAKKIEAIFQQLLSTAESFDFSQYGNAPEWKVFFEAWYLAIGLSEMRCEPGEEFRMLLGQCKDFLADSCAYWVLVGGCRNFSLTYYEQRFEKNHFSKDGSIYSGNRWFQNAVNLEGQWSMWSQMASDVTVIRSCYEYLCGRYPEKRQIYDSMVFRLRKKLAEAVAAATDIAGYLRDGGQARKLADNYDAISYELMF